MIQLVEKQQIGKRFILTENNYSFKELFSLVQNQFGKKAPSIEAGKWLLKIARYLDGLRSLFTGKEQTLTKETVIAALEKNTFNNQKIKDTLKYQFISLSDSVKFACEAYANDLKR
jgi:nucleoside-diphosphate-sugar epimerase